MPRDERRRQSALQKKAAKRKAKHRGSALVRPASLPKLPHEAARWPLFECLMSHDWKDPHSLVQIIVARRSPADEVAAAVFLVDLGCLGVKSAVAHMFDSTSAYEHGLRTRIQETQRLDRTDLNLAAKVIREGLVYARGLGFKPDPDYYTAATLLQDADPDGVRTSVPLGLNGKPYFFAGPYDNAPRILAQLTRAVGAGNFDFTVFTDELPFQLDDLDDGDEDFDAE